MAVSRYKTVDFINNVDEGYSKIFKKRVHKNGLVQMPTNELTYPSFEELKELRTVDVFWGLGHRFYKLANQYYGDPQYWWVIAYFNKAPTEHHVQVGDRIQIPLPLEEVLNLYGL